MSANEVSATAGDWQRASATAADSHFVLSATAGDSLQLGLVTAPRVQTSSTAFSVTSANVQPNAASSSLVSALSASSSDSSVSSSQVAGTSGVSTGVCACVSSHADACSSSRISKSQMLSNCILCALLKPVGSWIGGVVAPCRGVSWLVAACCGLSFAFALGFGQYKESSFHRSTLLRNHSAVLAAASTSLHRASAWSPSCCALFLVAPSLATVASFDDPLASSLTSLSIPPLATAELGCIDTIQVARYS